MSEFSEHDGMGGLAARPSRGKAAVATPEDKKSHPMNNIKEERAWLETSWELGQKMGMALANNEQVIYYLFSEDGPTPDIPFEGPILGSDEKERFLSEIQK